MAPQERSQSGPKAAQERPRVPQERAREPQEGPKRIPRWPIEKKAGEHEKRRTVMFKKSSSSAFYMLEGHTDGAVIAKPIFSILSEAKPRFIAEARRPLLPTGVPESAKRPPQTA